MADRESEPIVSTYIHVPRNAPISHTIDSTNFGVSAAIRIGNHGENDASLFFRSPEQLDALVEAATKAALWMRKAQALRSSSDGSAL